MEATEVLIESQLDDIEAATARLEQAKADFDGWIINQAFREINLVHSRLNDINMTIEHLNSLNDENTEEQKRHYDDLKKRADGILNYIHNLLSDRLLNKKQ